MSILLTDIDTKHMFCNTPNLLIQHMPHTSILSRSFNTELNLYFSKYPNKVEYYYSIEEHGYPQLASNNVINSSSKPRNYS
jgi:hypothetical protein